MTGQKALDKFDVVYNESYKDISRYVVLNANNIGDVKDILQNIYLEVYKNIDKVSDKNYVFGIAKNVLKKYYRFKFLRKDDTEITDNIIFQAVRRNRTEKKKNLKIVLVRVLAEILLFISGLMFLPEMFVTADGALNMGYLVAFLLVTLIAFIVTIVTYFIGGE